MILIDSGVDFFWVLGTMASTTPPLSQKLLDLCAEHYVMIEKLTRVIRSQSEELNVLRKDYQELLERFTKIGTSLEPSKATEDPLDHPVKKKRRLRPQLKPEDPKPVKLNGKVVVCEKIQDQPLDEVTTSCLDEFALNSENLLTSCKPYYTLQGEDFVTEERKQIKEIMSKAEVPGWRELDVSPTFEVADLEVTDDEVYARRHLKYELDEKKRKKWDLQRMKEQRHMERLRARYEEPRGSANGSGLVLSCLSNVPLQRSFFPLPEQATHILVTEELPVTAFGFQVPKLSEGFSLPWRTGD